ncbi:MAG: hypothetical protein AAB874_06755, partial [Patescibacteria group bacterium]
LSFLIGHFVSPGVFGEYTLIQSVLGMLTFLSLPGIDLALPKSIAQGFEGSLNLTWKLKFKLSLFGIPILLLFSLYYFFQQKTAIALGLGVGALFFPVLNTFTSYPAFLAGKRLFGKLAIYSSLSSLFFLACVGTISVLFPSTVILIFGYFIALIFPTVLFFNISKQLAQNSKVDTHLTGYATFLTTLSILPWISGNIGSIILERNMGAETLAIFAVASKFLTSVQKNFQVFYKPVTAKLASMDPANFRKTVMVHGVKLVIMGLSLCVTLYVATPFLIRFFFSQEYYSAIWYGQILSLALIPLPLTWVVSDMLVFQKQKLPQIFTSTLPHLIKLFLFLLVIPHFGIVGLIVIILIDRYFEPVLPLYFLYKHSGNK